MRSMMALRAHTQGGPEVLVYEPAPWPTPGTGEVQVSVHAAAITFDELTWPDTWAADGVDRTPVIPSHEFSGVVAEVGDGVAGFSVGDEVYGLAPFDRDGAAAEYVSVPATSVAIRPGTVSHVIAAAAVLPALTAGEALAEHSAVQPDQRVLVHGGAGGGRRLPPNWRRFWGRTSRARRTPRRAIRPLAGRRPRDQHRPRAAGCRDGGLRRRDRRRRPGRTGSPVRGAPPRRTPDHPAGTPSQELADEYGVTALFFVVTAEQNGLARIDDMIDTDRLKVGVAATFPLAEGRAAYESGTTRRAHPGKTVLTVQDRPVAGISP